MKQNGASYGTACTARTELRVKNCDTNRIMGFVCRYSPNKDYSDRINFTWRGGIMKLLLEFRNDFSLIQRCLFMFSVAEITFSPVYTSTHLNPVSSQDNDVAFATHCIHYKLQGF